jgi:hypothetical protein
LPQSENRKLKSHYDNLEILRPNFVIFLKKLFEITGGEFRIVNRYEVGEKLGLDSSETDDTVKQLSEIGMLKIMSLSKIILTQKALAVIHRTETSG